MWLVALALGCASEPLPPAASGELTVVQIDLGGAALGEATLVVGPDGTSALIDVGNDKHAGDVAAAVEAVTGDAAVDWVVLTHAHADHIGGMDKLAEWITVRRGVVHRGFLATGDANTDELREVCEADLPMVPLCGGDPAPCSFEGEGAPWPITACPALPMTLELGSGAAIVLYAAGGHVMGEPIGDVTADENALSVAGVVQWGRFGLAFGGDLTGGGKDTPDVEGAIVERLDAVGVLSDVEVVKLHHHGIRSSTSAAWVDALLPDDGHDRLALVGANGTYLAAPHQEVVDRVAPRVRGILVTDGGSLAGEHEELCVAKGPVILTVTDGGDRFAASGRCSAGPFTSF